MNGEQKISAVIIAKNEEKNLPDCIKSVNWADEVLVFDNDSQDATYEIAKKLGCRVFKFVGGDFSERKNAAFKKASGDWILSLDADERVTPKLKNEINLLFTVHGSPFAVFAIPRQNIILGKELKHGWWPDYVIRLFRKDAFLGYKGKLHEQPKYTGVLGYLRNPLIHLKHDNLSEMVTKTNEWSEIEARLMFESGHPPMNVPRFISAIFREFRQRFLMDKAFLDGKEGVIYGIYQIFSRFISYAKLWEMQSSSKLKVPSSKF